MRRRGPQHTRGTGHDAFDELVAHKLDGTVAAGRNQTQLMELRDQGVVV